MHSRVRRALRRLVSPAERRATAPVAAPVAAPVRAMVEVPVHVLQDPTRLSVPERLEAGVQAAARYPARAWSMLRDLPPEVWTLEAAEAYVRSGLAQDRPRVLDALRQLLTAASDDLPAEVWLSMIGPVFAVGEHRLAAQMFDRVDRLVGDGAGVDPEVVLSRDWLRPWMQARPDAPSAPPVAPDRISFAVMDYGHPDRTQASVNIGDHVQSLASLGHVVRHQELRFAGDPELVGLLTRLQDRVRQERVVTGTAAEVELIQVDRDASTYAAIPPGTWTLGFGWFMHPIFGIAYDFPLHPNLLPIFVSFHCSKRELLSDAALEYLRTYGPIGCRDWTTVDLLLSADVPAFFSGCLTTTIDTVFPHAETGGVGGPTAYVDMPRDAVPPGAPTFRHRSEQIRQRSFTRTVDDAVGLLETYRRDHSSVVTSRLHCYLPTRSLGVPVDFRPKNPADPRFAGLYPITDEAFDAIRDGLNTKVEQVLRLVLSGGAPRDVYTLWQELNADAVELARHRHEVQRPMSPASTDLVAACADVVPGGQTDADGAVHVLTHLVKGGRRALRAMLHSLAKSSSRPVHAWVFARTVDPPDLHRLQRDNLTITVLSTGECATLFGPDGSRVAGRDLGDLIAPAIIRADRLVYLPPRALVTGDVAELADLGLGGSLIAAPDVVGTQGTSGFGVLSTAGNRLRGDTAKAEELRRIAFGRHRFDFAAFSTEVLVLDAAAWRDRDLTREYAAYVETFGLSFREVLHLEAGPGRVVLPERWYVVPERSAVTSPSLVVMP